MDDYFNLFRDNLQYIKDIDDGLTLRHRAEVTQNLSPLSRFPKTESVCHMIMIGQLAAASENGNAIITAFFRQTTHRKDQF